MTNFLLKNDTFTCKGSVKYPKSDFPDSVLAVKSFEMNFLVMLNSYKQTLCQAYITNKSSSFKSS